MTDFKRLTMVTILSKDQINVTKQLIDREGLCSAVDF